VRIEDATEDYVRTCRISVIGMGYVGLATAVGFVMHGHYVRGIDIDPDRIEILKQGIIPFTDSTLGDVFSNNIKIGNNFDISTHYNLLDTDITFICVGTPSDTNGKIDLTYVKEACEKISPILKEKNSYHLIVVKSTVIPGTIEGFVIPLLESLSGLKAGVDFGVAANPEFLEEGKALLGFLKSTRTVVGINDEYSGHILEKLYTDFDTSIIKTTIKTAEMIKYASNVCLATRISIINELGNICKEVGVDVYDVAKVIGLDPRIGNRYLDAGIGFGGSCLPKDLKAMINTAKEHGIEPRLMESILKVNERQPLLLIELTRKRLGGLRGKIITVLGLAFKENTDDMRDSPAITIIKVLLHEGAIVKAYDPLAMKAAKKVLPKNVNYCASASEAITDTDCVLIVTAWNEFKDEKLYDGKIVIDGRRIIKSGKAKNCKYEGIGW
jgi:UDPglucose 6-dehydrogenase